MKYVYLKIYIFFYARRTFSFKQPFCFIYASSEKLLASDIKNFRFCLNLKINQIDHWIYHWYDQDYCKRRQFRERSSCLNRSGVKVIMSRLSPQLTKQSHLQNVSTFAIFVLDIDFPDYLIQNGEIFASLLVIHLDVSEGYDCAARELSCV